MSESLATNLSDSFMEVKLCTTSVRAGFNITTLVDWEGGGGSNLYLYINVLVTVVSTYSSLRARGSGSETTHTVVPDCQHC